MMIDDDSATHQSKSFIRHLGFWFLVTLALAVTVALLVFWFSGGQTLRVFLLNVLVSFVFAVCNGLVLGTTLARFGTRIAAQRFPFNWILLIIIGFALTAIGCWLAGSILIRLGLFPRGDFWSWYLQSLRIGILLSVIFSIGTFIYEGFKARLEAAKLQLQMKELEGERARKLAVEAQLSSLESRIHPHFLFNTLNSISALIQEDPRQAELLVERLAALLRFSLDSSRQRTVPLKQELKIVMDYLEIEKARFGDRLRYAIEVPPEFETVEVPPLSLQTLVENSVKFAVSSSRSGGNLRLSATLVDGRMLLEVRDSGPGFEAASITDGHGLDNLQARLAALFDGRAALDISRQNGHTVVTVSLPYPQFQKISQL